LLLCGTVTGADDFVELTLWGSEHLLFLRRFLPFARGIPSHDTLCEVVAALDPALFKTCFTNWVERLRGPRPETIAVDGKTSRRSHARSQGRGPLHTVSAWATAQRLVLGQEAVPEKSNEITAIPLLLQRLEQAGALVTIDAMGTQTAIARTVLDGGGDYVLALKQNQPGACARVEALFAAPPAAVGTHRTVESGHGRLEARTHHVCHDVSGLLSGRGCPGELVFPGLAMVGMVESQTDRDGRIGRERRYYLCSATLDAETVARVVRSHWGIENRLHWVLDVMFRDDLARLRTSHGPANMAVVKHMALNLLRQAKPTLILKNRRKRAGWNTEYLAALVQQTA